MYLLTVIAHEGAGRLCSKFREVETASPCENEIAREAVTVNLMTVIAVDRSWQILVQILRVETASSCQKRSV